MSMSDLEARPLDLEIGRVGSGVLFEQWLQRFTKVIWPVLCSNEGGFSNVITDAGGPTIYGVTWITLRNLWQKYPTWCAAHGLQFVPETATAATVVDEVRALTIEQAHAIAFIFYYTRPRFCLLRGPFDLLGLDYRYNGGPAITDLQKVAGAVPDGSIGPGTAKAVNVLDWFGVERYQAKRLAYLRSLDGPHGWAVNGRGWSVRLRHLERVAHHLWTQPIQLSA